MDSINISSIKLKKAKAIKKHNQLQMIANVFRVVEICMILALISRFSIHLPVAVKNSSEYFKGLTVILASPRFVFIVGNAIVITLFAKSGHFSGQDSSAGSSKTDFYEEFVKKSEKIHGIHQYETVCREKQSISVKHVISEHPCSNQETKIYQRSQSQHFEKPICNKSNRELRRSVTEKCNNRNVRFSEGLVNSSYPEDKMSNEEFKCVVESFIEQQKRFRRDEENSVF